VGDHSRSGAGGHRLRHLLPAALLLRVQGYPAVPGHPQLDPAGHADGALCAVRHGATADGARIAVVGVV